MSRSASAEGAAEVRLEGIQHRFGEVWAVRGISLTVKPGEFLTLLGPSGSGKTTLLRIIGGLLRPSEGRVYVAGQDITAHPPQKRNMGFVFQNYALFPHLSVYDNVAFPLQIRRMRRQTIRDRVNEVLTLVQLTGLENRYPAQLSGGQQQRVSLARAIVFYPNVLLMDEPLGSLDKRLRQQLQLELRHLQHDLGITAIYVTHDQEEAFAMSDRIAVVHEGELRQLDQPSQVYRKPGDSFIADFVGDLNRFEGELVQSNGPTGVLRTSDGMEILISLHGVAQGSRQFVCGIRPERVEVGENAVGDNRYRGVVRALTFQGTHYRCELELPNGRRVSASIYREDPGVREGEEVWLGWNAEEALVFGGDFNSNESGFNER